MEVDWDMGLVGVTFESKGCRVLGIGVLGLKALVVLDKRMMSIFQFWGVLGFRVLDWKGFMVLV